MSPKTAPTRTKPGDLVIVAGHHVGERERIGEIREVLGTEGYERYRVYWDDGRESIFYPASDAVIRHKTRQKNQ